MSQSDGSARRGDGRSESDGPDSERTEVFSDEYDYFYAPRSSGGASGRTPQQRHTPQQFGPHGPRGPQRPYEPRPGQGRPTARSRGSAPARPPRRRGWRGLSVGRKIGVVLAVLALLVLVLWLYVNAALMKVNALTDYEGRPADTPGQTWLLVGSDSREGLSAEERRTLNTGKAGGGRTDTIMLMHVSPFGGRSTLVSLPRDTLVEIPAFVDEDGERHPAQDAKLNAAFAYGGPRLLARTVEQTTGMHIDEYMEIGFGGFANVVDAVGGVRMCLDQPLRDEKAGANLAAGCQNLNGEEALAYVRSRYAVEGGDLGRVEHQRKFLRNLAGEVSKPTTLLNPIAMTRLTNASLGALVVDEDTGPFNLAWFAWQMKGLTSGDGTTITVPVEGTASVSGVGSVVLWEEEQAKALFEALRQNEPIPQSIVSEQG